MDRSDQIIAASGTRRLVPTTAGMTMATVPEFASLLSQTMGLSADSVGLSFIEAALKTRLSACKLKDLHDYWEHVHACETELQELIDAVIVPETWFFRD